MEDAMELVNVVNDIINKANGIDLRLRSQILDAVQSISSNIAEGFCRRTINEYLQSLNIALGSTGETMTRMIGLRKTNIISEERFEEFDKLHFEVENKLLALIKSLQAKRRQGTWEEELRDPEVPYSS